jgi:hypothetical protein
LFEVSLGAFFLAGLLLVAGLATDRSLALFRQRRASEELNSSAYRLLQRVAGEVRFARETSLAPPTLTTQGASQVRFQESLGVAGGATQWGPFTALRWESEPADPEDGLDNDGDGRTDEGQALWVENEGLPNERRTVLGHGLSALLPGETLDGADEDGDGLVDERGLSFFLEDGLLTIRLGLEAPSPTGQLLRSVVETSVLIRN